MSREKGEKGCEPEALASGQKFPEGNPIVARGWCGKCGATLFEIQIHFCGHLRLCCETCREVWEPPGWYRHDCVVS